MSQCAELEEIEAVLATQELLAFESVDIFECLRDEFDKTACFQKPGTVNEIGQKERDRIALFTVDFSHLHYNVIQRGCKAISGLNYKTARNCLTYMLDFIVMQISRVNREKGSSNSTRYRVVDRRLSSLR